LPTALDADIDAGVMVGLNRCIQADLPQCAATDVDRTFTIKLQLDAQQVTGTVALLHGVQPAHSRR